MTAWLQPVSLTGARNVIADIEAYPKRPLHEASQIADNEQVLDVGPFTGAFIAGVVQYAGTVVWSGTLGDVLVEGRRNPIDLFAHGSELVVEALTGQFGRRPERTIVVADDTVQFVTSRGIASSFDHVSTGGGASLELLSGHTLPGITVALEEK